MASMVVTLIGPDRPGIVETVAEVVRSNGGNWLESRMSHLAGQFAGILLLQVPDQNVTAIQDGLAELKDRGLKIVAEVDESAAATSRSGRSLMVQVVGNDRPGIVRELTQVLAGHDVNVEELTTTCEDAPHSGGQIFRAVGRVRAPTDLNPELLQEELERLAADLMIDVTSESEAAD